MNTSIGPISYTWNEPWGDLPASEGWAHHGVAVTRDGLLVVGDPTDPVLHFLKPDGTRVETLSVPVTDPHGISVSEENGVEILWIVDNGVKHDRPKGNAQILKCDRKGTVLSRLVEKDFGPAHENGFYPTACAVDPNSGHLWVADGYGSSRVFRFSSDLKLELTLDGTEGAAGRFDCPHVIWVDTRKADTEIYIADRSNDRIQIYSPEGTFLRCLDQGFITPSAFATFDDKLVVAELVPRLLILDINDNILGETGANREATDRPGWPNREVDGAPVPPTEDLVPGKFNSPHGLAADPQGNIYISEWLLGGRYIQLKR